MRHLLVLVTGVRVDLSCPCLSGVNQLESSHCRSVAFRFTCQITCWMLHQSQTDALQGTLVNKREPGVVPQGFKRSALLFGVIQVVSSVSFGFCTESEEALRKCSAGDEILCRGVVCSRCVVEAARLQTTTIKGLSTSNCPTARTPSSFLTWALS